MKRNNTPSIKNLFIELLPLFAIIILSLLPAYQTLGRLDIGGDVMIFLDSKIIASKYLYQWIVNEPNGQYFSTSYYAVYGIYKFLSFLGLNIYGISFVLLFVLNLIAGLGVWFLTRLFSKSAHPCLHIIAIAFYLLSPALLNAWHYNFIYAAIPWFFYLTFKVIKYRHFSNFDIALFTAAILFSSTELPNPKYLFYLSVVFVVSILSAIIFKMVSFAELKKMFWGIILILLISAYLFLPMAYFVKNYSAAVYGVHTQEGYSDEGEMMNYGRDTLDKVLKLHQDQIFLNTAEAQRYNRNKLITILSYLFIFLIVLSLWQFKNLNPEDKKYRLIIFLLLLVFIFFSAGPNPPLGYFYQLAVSKIGVLAFLRTTAGGVFILSIIYSVLLFLALAGLKRFKLLVMLALILVIFLVGYPYLNGEYFRNFNNVSKFTDRGKNGFVIPEPYFKVKKLLDGRKLDAKIYYPNSKLSYLNTSWGFFGPVIYNFLFQNSSISYDKMYSNLSNHNIGYIFIDNSLLEKKNFEDIKEKILLLHSDFVDLYSFNRDKFLPHFYVPQKVTKLDGDLVELKNKSQSENIRSSFALVQQNTNSGLDVLSSPEILPTIEFKKINITKYRLVIHGAKSNFPLVFSESFNKDWRLYVLPYGPKSENELLTKIENYQVIPNNETDQADRLELVDFVNRGLITELGESKAPDFVSKNFAGTIQNDNLTNGNPLETWGAKQISQKDHFVINGYANAWEIDPKSFCDSNICRDNPDGSQDFQIVIEFWPQRLVYIGLLIGLGAILLVFAAGVIIRMRRK